MQESQISPDATIRNQISWLNTTLRHARKELGADITAQRLLILINVFLNEGLSQGELLRQLDSTSATALSRNLAELSDWTPRKVEGPGLIELRADRFNLRRKQVFLTGKGHAFIQSWLTAMDQHPHNPSPDPHDSAAAPSRE